MVLDHGREAGIADQRRPEHAEAEAIAAAALDETQRHRGGEQAVGSVTGQADAPGDVVEATRPLGQELEHAQLDAGQQHLRIHEAGDEVEDVAGAAAGDPSCEWKARRPGLERWRCEQAVAPAEPALAQAASDGL